MMKIDTFLPNFDFAEKHHKLINAAPLRVYQTLEQLDLSESKWISLLFWLRGLKRLHFQDIKTHFIVLDDRPGEEIVLGMLASPWQPDGNIHLVPPAEFVQFEQLGLVKMAWNFTFEPVGNRTLVTTETRIKCEDSSSLNKFRIYWFFVRPFSGLVRKEMLKLLEIKSTSS